MSSAWKEKLCLDFIFVFFEFLNAASKEFRTLSEANVRSTDDFGLRCFK